VTVSITVNSLQGEKIGEDIHPEELFFDVNAKLDEQKRSSGEVTLAFSLLIGTKPNIAKYSTAGIVTLEGDMQNINKRLETNPKTKIPQILFAVYQHVFSSIYLLSSVLKTPYPPPDLLHSMEEKIRILPQGFEDKTSQLQNDKPPESVQTAVEHDVPAKTTEEQSADAQRSVTAPQTATVGDAGKTKSSNG
jgi:hypothetical protein